MEVDSFVTNEKTTIAATSKAQSLLAKLVDRLYAAAAANKVVASLPARNL